MKYQTITDRLDWFVCDKHGLGLGLRCGTCTLDYSSDNPIQTKRITSFLIITVKKVTWWNVAEIKYNHVLVIYFGVGSVLDEELADLVHW